MTVAAARRPGARQFQARERGVVVEQFREALPATTGLTNSVGSSRSAAIRERTRPGVPDTVMSLPSPALSSPIAVFRSPLIRWLFAHARS
jgi:hypothetical protein